MVLAKTSHEAVSQFWRQFRQTPAIQVIHRNTPALCDFIGHIGLERFGPLLNAAVTGGINANGLGKVGSGLVFVVSKRLEAFADRLGVKWAVSVQIYSLPFCMPQIREYRKFVYRSFVDT